MASAVRLSTVVLLLEAVFLAGAPPVLGVDAVSNNSKAQLNGLDGRANVDIATTLYDIQQRLMSLEKMLDVTKKELSLEVKRNFLKRDIVAAIERQDFRFADWKLSQSGDMVPISDIVHEVYAGCDCNFHLLVRFMRSSTDVVPCYKILPALYGEVKRNGHKDMAKMITLLKVFALLKESNTPLTVKSFIDEFINEISTDVADALSAGIETDSEYLLNENVAEIREALGCWDANQTSAVMKLTVEKAFKTIDHVQILEAINRYANLRQRISGMDALYEQLKAAGPLKGAIVFQLASRLSLLEDHTELGGLVRDLYEKFPLSIKTVFSGQEFCFYNKLLDSYLVASPTSFDEEHSRNVYAVPRPADGLLPRGAKWIVNATLNMFIESFNFPREYLLMTTTRTNNEPLHFRLVTSTLGMRAYDEGPVNLELDGENCLLHDVASSEYFHVSGSATDSKFFYLRRAPYASIKLPTALWQIIDCSHALQQKMELGQDLDIEMVKAN